MADKKAVSYATGKRKTAVARVRLVPGAGAITINKRGFEDYFPRETSRMRIVEPLQITETAAQFDVFAEVTGGGVSAQADAVRHGISRALVVVAETMRPTLRKAGMLTRDPRAVERKKYGKHKARKRPQYSKR
jgi:small subunit ribosomal protein S9